MKKKKNTNKNFFNRFSNIVTTATGTPVAFYVAFFIILIWGITGPLFNFSDTWQLVINTSTTIITFLMVFVIQHSQNKDTKAIQIKLDELIAANSEASNRVVDIEELTDEELAAIKKFYTHLSQSVKKQKDVFSSHSLDETKQKLNEVEQKLDEGKKRINDAKKSAKKNSNNLKQST
jgi:low affinity Fe/Cu permease